MKSAIFLSVVLLLAQLAWAADTAPATSAATAPALLAIRYQRTGGFAGTNDLLVISPAGDVSLQGRLMGSGKGKLTVDETAALLKLFAGWGKLNDKYPPPAGLADGFQVVISYGTKEVSAGDGSQTPAPFEAVRTLLEKIAAEVKGK